MKKLRHIATRLLICVLVLSQTYIPKNAYANVITEQNLQTEETVNIKEKKSIIIEDKYEVIFSIEDQWNEKFQGNITIKNTSDHALKNWSLNFIMNHEIDNIWNAEITSHNNDTYILKNNNSNEIAPGACISIGYQATYTDIIQLPSQCKLTYVTQ